MAVTLTIDAERPGDRKMAKMPATVTAMTGPAGASLSDLAVLGRETTVPLGEDGTATIVLDQVTVSDEPIIYRVEVGKIVRHLDLSALADGAEAEWGDPALLVVDSSWLPPTWVPVQGPAGPPTYTAVGEEPDDPVDGQTWWDSDGTGGFFVWDADEAAWFEVGAEGLGDLVAAETAARIAADNALTTAVGLKADGTALTAETAARAAADTAHTAAIALKADDAATTAALALKASTAALSALAATVVPEPAYGSALWHTEGSGVTDLAVARGYTWWVPFRVRAPMTVNGLSCLFHTTPASAGAVIRYAIYTIVNGAPAALIVDGGTDVADVASRFAAVTFGTVTLSPGYVALAATIQGSAAVDPIMRVMPYGNATSLQIGASAPVRNSREVAAHWRSDTNTSITGAYPSTAPALNAGPAASISPPRIWVRTA